MKAIFSMKEILDSGIIQWSMDHPCNRPYHKTIVPPCLHIVNDDGVYLMAGATEPQWDQKWSGPSQKCVCVYAKGHGPGKGFSGDDFCEAITLTNIKALLEAKAKKVVVNFTKTRMTVSGFLD